MPNKNENMNINNDISFIISTDTPSLNDEEKPYIAIAIDTVKKTFLEDE